MQELHLAKLEVKAFEIEPETYPGGSKGIRDMSPAPSMPDLGS